MTVVAAMAVQSSILIILGPTASGKSAAALQLAEQTGSEILSVDSMQVYRGMDIGTAKPSLADRRAVVHHLVDVADSDTEFTVARFVEMARRVIADAAARGKPLIATGGTPLYYKALFDGLFEGPAADSAIRGRLETLSPEDLTARLSEVDPAAATRIHMNDRKRLILRAGGLSTDWQADFLLADGVDRPQAAPCHHLGRAPLGARRTQPADQHPGQGDARCRLG